MFYNSHRKHSAYIQCFLNPHSTLKSILTKPMIEIVINNLSFRAKNDKGK